MVRTCLATKTSRRAILMLPLLVLLSAFLPIASASADEPGFVWWEGEAASKTNFPANSWFSPQGAEKDVLSGGAWLSNAGKRAAGSEEAYAIYDVKVAAAGKYNLWARKFWKHGPFRWRFDDQKFQDCTRDVALADSQTLRTNVSANWVYLGQVTLTAGAHKFELRLDAKEGEDMTACFDAFVLASGAFFPNGKLKPGEKSGLSEDGWFAWEPSPDAFSDGAKLDLRGLNEKEAGVAGWVKRKSADFTLGDGTPVRFWAVNVSSETAAQDRPSVDYMARRLAKLGVNMVRYHSPLFIGKDVAKVDAKRLDDLMYMVAALKKQGIYTTISFYFPLWLDAKAAGLDGYDTLKNDKPFGALYYDEKMIALWQGWAKALLTTADPYNDKTLAQEPAAAIVEIVNEDSLFFWTFSQANVPAAAWRGLEQRFAKQLVAKYGSLDKAMAAWGSCKNKDDDVAGGIAGLMDPWNMTTAGIGKDADKHKRMGDQAEFLAGVQRGFYESARDHLRKTLGYGGLISCSNWQTADPQMLDAIERQTYTAGDVIDRHGYFGGKHTGEGAAWSVRVGHQYEELPAVLSPRGLPLEFRQIEGYPHIITELMWTQPSRYRSDMTFLSACYGSLQGVDGMYFFALGSNYVGDTSIGKFQVATPAVAGTFPAAALVYRRGDVKTPAPALLSVLKMSDLYAMKGESSAASAALDELRKPTGASDPKAAAAGAEDLAYYVGPVVRSFAASESSRADLAKIDTAKKTIASSTGELAWDYGSGLVKLNSPRAKGMAGFLAKAGAVDLGGVTVESKNEYGAIMVVAMDDQPLDKSKRILVQAMTEDKPYGFKADGGKITSIGSYPFLVRKIDAKVTLKGAAGKVTALDANGMGTPTKVQTAGDKDLAVQLPTDAVYCVIER